MLFIRFIRKKMSKQLFNSLNIEQSNKMNGLSLFNSFSCLNKDLAFSVDERRQHKLVGLLPPAHQNQELQVSLAIENFRSIAEPLQKYVFLRELQDRNESVFFRLAQKFTKEILPIVYTPIVGLACQKYSFIFRRPRGMFITLQDAGKILDILGNWPEPSVRAIVVSDGERILGLGDQGANGMGIPVGKMTLYSALGGIPPHMTLPVLLDVGTNNQTYLDDPYYIGLKQKRAFGQVYDDFVDEFMKAVVRKFGQTCLIQFEDFGNRNAFRLLEKYQHKYCTFNDDIQGTASVALAGLLTTLRMIPKKLSQHRIVFYGAGEAAIGIADLIVVAMRQEGLDQQEARKRIYLIDSQGLITKTRQTNLNEHKKKYAQNVNEAKSLLDVVNLVEPTCLIGVAAVPKTFSESVLRRMAELNENPIIFALSNPTSQAECTAEEAYQYTEGRAIFASGSPFDPVIYDKKTFVPQQANNSYIFPGVALAVIATQTAKIVDEVFLVAAQALSTLTTDSDLKAGSLYPPLDNIFETTLQVATKIAEWLYSNGYAQHQPEPENKYKFLREFQFNPQY